MSENKISVCHITSAHPPFDGRIFHKECVSLAEAGYHVNLVATHTKSEVVKGVQLVPLSTSKGRFYRFFVKSFQAFFKGLKTKSKVYHLHDPELLPSAILFKICGKKVVFDMHELVYHQIADKDYLGGKVIRKIMAGTYRLMERIAVRVVDRIILAEDGYRSYFEKNYPKRLNKVVFIRNYPIIGLIDNALQTHSSAKGTSGLTLVYAGNLTQIRGIREICEAVKASNEELRLVLMGKWESDTYKEKCLVDSDRIEYKGVLPLEQVYPVMAGCDLGVSLLYPVENYLTSLPVKAFEYMACGLPMIMSDFPYWLKTFDGVACFANPTSVKEIQEVLEQISRDKETLKKMGDEAFKRVREQFSWEAEAGNLVEMYSQLVKK